MDDTGYRKVFRKAKKWAKVKNKVKSLDPTLEEAQKTDIIIPVMGPTGVGKSTFINTLCGTQVVQVGHDLESCTALLKPVVIQVPQGPYTGRRLILVDTPGFDDTYVDDSEILYRIAHWLAASYDGGMKLAGVVYLYDISQTRMLGTTRKNLEMFRRLCGDDALKSIILGTTKWGNVTKQVGEMRETQLRSNFWKDMIKAGSPLCRFEGTKASAWAVLGAALQGHFDSTVLQIQREVVDHQKLIPDTDAGKHLREVLEKAVMAQKKRVQGSDDDAEGYQEIQDELRLAVEALQVLRISLSRRILIFLNIA